MGAVKELWQRSQEQAHEQFGWLAGDEWFVESYGNA